MVKLLVAREAILDLSTDESGFTLIELLAALAIFSLLMSLVAVSFSSAVGLLRHLDLPYAAETRALSNLRDSLGSSFVYIGQQQRRSVGEDGLFRLFSGQPDEMTFVSAQPLQVEAPALCRLWLENDQLLLEESPVYDRRYDYLAPQLQGRETIRMVLAENVTQLELNYLFAGQLVDRLRDEIPALVKITYATEQRRRELHVRIGSNFADKKSRTALYSGEQ